MFFFPFFSGVIILHIIYPLSLFLDILSYLNSFHVFLIDNLGPPPQLSASPIILNHSLIHPFFLIPLLFILFYFCYSHFLILPFVSLIDFFLSLSFFFIGCAVSVMDRRSEWEIEELPSNPNWLCYIYLRANALEKVMNVSPHPQAMWNKGYRVENA